MKIPYWDSTITLYSRTTAADGSVSWKRSVHANCFWKRTIMRDRVNGAELRTTSVVCRMPAPYPDVRVGDIIVHGVVNDAIDEYTTGARATDLLLKYPGRSVLVGEVHGNSRKMLGVDHLYIGG